MPLVLPPLRFFADFFGGAKYHICGTEFFLLDEGNSGKQQQLSIILFPSPPTIRLSERHIICEIYFLARFLHTPPHTAYCKI